MLRRGIKGWRIFDKPTNRILAEGWPGESDRESERQYLIVFIQQDLGKASLHRGQGPLLDATSHGALDLASMLTAQPFGF